MSNSWNKDYSIDDLLEGSKRILTELFSELRSICRYLDGVLFFDSSFASLVEADGRLAVYGFRRRLLLETSLDQLGSLPEGQIVHAASAEIVLASSSVLIRDLHLPLQAKGNLDQAIAMQLDRQLPIAQQDLCCSYSIVADDKQNNGLRVRLYVVRKELVRNLKAHLDDVVQTDANLSVAYIDQGKRVEFEATSHKPGRRLGLNTLLLLVLVFLAGSMAFLDSMKKEQELSGLELRIGELHPKVMEVGRLQENIRSMESDIRQVTKPAEFAPVSEILTDLSKRLPEGTWLQTLQVKQGRVVIRGYSANALELLPLIEASEHVASVSFSSATTRDRSADAERFEITMSLKNGG